jgi:hypothetical protein
MEWLPWLPILIVALIAVPAAFRVGERTDPLGAGFRSFRERMRGRVRR